MNIHTKFHGKQEITEEQIIKFESGLPGFVDEKEFYILPLDETPFLILQSIRTKEVAFIMTDPFNLFPDYEFDLSEDIMEALKIHSEKDVAVFVILTVSEPFTQTTANLQAPVIINQNKKLGKQFILNNTSYTTKHLIIQPPMNSGQEVK